MVSEKEKEDKVIGYVKGKVAESRMKNLNIDYDVVEVEKKKSMDKYTVYLDILGIDAYDKHTISTTVYLKDRDGKIGISGKWLNPRYFSSNEDKYKEESATDNIPKHALNLIYLRAIKNKLPTKEEKNDIEIMEYVRDDLMGKSDFRNLNTEYDIVDKEENDREINYTIDGFITGIEEDINMTLYYKARKSSNGLMLSGEYLNVTLFGDTLDEGDISLDKSIRGIQNSLNSLYDKGVKRYLDREKLDETKVKDNIKGELSKLLEKEINEVEYDIGVEISEVENNKGTTTIGLRIKGTRGDELGIITIGGLPFSVGKSNKVKVDVDKGVKGRLSGRYIEEHNKLESNGVVNKRNKVTKEGKVVSVVKEGIGIITGVFNDMGMRTGYESVGRVRYLGVQKGDKFGMQRLQNVAKTLGKYPNVNSEVLKNDKEGSKYNMGAHVKVKIGTPKGDLKWSINGNAIRDDIKDKLDHKRGENAEESLNKIIEGLGSEFLEDEENSSDLVQIVTEFIRITNMVLDKSRIKLEKFRDESDVKRLKRVVEFFKNEGIQFKTSEDPEGIGIGKHVKIPVVLNGKKAEVSFNHIAVRLSNEGGTTRKGLLYIHNDESSPISDANKLKQLLVGGVKGTKYEESVNKAIDAYFRAIDLRRSGN